MAAAYCVLNALLFFAGVLLGIGALMLDDAVREQCRHNPNDGLGRAAV